MSKAQLMVPALLVVLLLVAACAPKTAPAPQAPVPAPAAAAAPVALTKAAWEVEWEKALEAAKREGTVVISTMLGGAGRAAISEAFKRAYGIPVESISGKGGEVVEKVLRERRAGLYNYDISMVGSTNAINVLKPAGALDPLEPALILPDVTDPELIKKVWWPDKLWWVDADHTHLAPALRLNFFIAININLVKDGEIKSYRDLLNPKWQGKLVLADPAITGGGANFVTFADAVLGWDYLVELAKAKPTILRDWRLMVEWLAHAKVAVVVGPSQDTLSEFIGVGAPVKGIIPTEGSMLVGGMPNVSIYNRPPHLNAAKVFINWYLSKEGQAIIAPAAGSQSLRLDVPTAHLSPEQIRQPGMKYFVKEDEKAILAQPEQQKKASELFSGPPVRK